MRLLVISLTLVCISFQVIRAQDPIVLSDPRQLLEIGKHLSVYEDKSGVMTINDITPTQLNSQFIQNTTDVPNIGNTRSAIWCRLSVVDRVGIDWFLRLSNPYLDTVQCFIRTGTSFKMIEAGSTSPFSQRLIKATNIIIPLRLQKDSITDVYLRIRHHIVFIPLQIGTLDAIMQPEADYNLIFGVYFGIVFIVIIVNTLLYLPFRDNDLIFYILWLCFFGVYVSLQKGYLIKMVPDSMMALNKNIGITAYIAQFMLVVFTMNFLKVKHFSRLLYSVCVLMLLLDFGSMFVYFTEYRYIAAILVEGNSVIGSMFILVYSYIIYRRGFKPARFYALAFTVSMSCFVIFGLHSMGQIPSNIVTQHALAFGTIWEMVFLTFAVIDKIYTLRNEKYEVERENSQLILQQNVILEKKVEERTRELENEKMKSDELLLNILPEETAAELKSTGHSKARIYNAVTIMFTDFKNFTNISEVVSADLLVKELDYCFSKFDDIVSAHGIEKIKTVGDSYLCAAGLPAPSLNHATDTVNAAIEIIAFLEQRRTERVARGEFSFEVRIGIHSGSVIAGIVGKKKFAYDIWSDAVNIASRMESSGEPGKINISGATYDLVKDRFTCTHRGKIEAKNKGEIDMYFVSGQ